MEDVAATAMGLLFCFVLFCFLVCPWADPFFDRKMSLGFRV
jgi:hypothetical protein